jgi:hypothetical protein
MFNAGHHKSCLFEVGDKEVTPSFFSRNLACLSREWKISAVISASCLTDTRWLRVRLMAGRESVSPKGHRGKVYFLSLACLAIRGLFPECASSITRDGWSVFVLHS